jgi:hypothetical protein
MAYAKEKRVYGSIDIPSGFVRMRRISTDYPF